MSGGYTIGSGDAKMQKQGRRLQGRIGFYIMGGCIVTEQLDGSGLESVYRISTKRLLKRVVSCDYVWAPRLHPNLVHFSKPMFARGPFHARPVAPPGFPTGRELSCLWGMTT